MRESLGSNYHGKRYYAPIVSTIEKIKKTLSMHEVYTGKELVEKINNRTEQLLRYFGELKKIHNNDTTILLPIVLDFLQDFYKNFGITYFYNRSPDVSYDEYDDYPIGQQILNNIFDGKVYIKKNCLIKEDYIMGGSCHHWTLVIKKIFETIDLPGVTCLINKNLPYGHAFISIEYLSRTWVIDPLPQTQKLLDQHLYVMDEQDISRFGTPDHTQALDPEMQTISQFHDRAMYKNNILNNLQHQSIKMKISSIEIEITRNKLLYKYRDFDKIQRVFDLDIHLPDDLSDYTKSELLAEIFSGVQPLLSKEVIPLVSKKISEEKLFALFK